MTRCPHCGHDLPATGQVLHMRYAHGYLCAVYRHPRPERIATNPGQVTCAKCIAAMKRDAKTEAAR